MPQAKSLSILQVLEKGDFNTGSVVQMYQLARGLAQRGHRIGVVTRPGTEVAERARVDGLEVFELALRGSFDFQSARALGRAYEQTQADLVHAHKGIAHAVALGATFFSKRRPLLVANRGVSFPLYFLNRWKYRIRLAAVVAVCEDTRRVVIASGGLAPEMVHVVHAGVDPAVFDPARVDGERIRREWGIAAGERLLVQVSARNYKGWRDLLAGAAMLSREHPHLKVALVACPDDASKAAVEDAARTLGIGNRVIAVGYRQDVPDILGAADVVADLSWAGLGITGTLREAMALGKPVVASSAGGNPELVADGVSGLLVPPRDPAAFAAALRRLLEDPELARRLGAGGHERVLAGFTVEARLDRMESLYRRLIAAEGRTEATVEATARGM